MLPCCRHLAVAALLSVAVLSSGCGKKTPLVPPQLLVPEPVTDLRFTLEGNLARLEWSFPAKMENGEPLETIEVFELLRAAIPEEDYCDGCPINYDREILVDGGPLPAAGGTGRAVYQDTGLKVGYRYLYKVRSRAGWWYPSRDSNEVSFVWRLPPKPPENVRVAAGDRQLTLSWEPVEHDTDGKFLEEAPVYQVYRRGAGNNYAALGSPVQDRQFTDTGLKNKTSYTYLVQTLVANDHSLQKSGFSREATGVPRDLVPPDRPENPVAVALPDGVKLVWQAVADDDLAGYRIYRRQEGSAGSELVAEVGAEQNQYTDRRTPSGNRWFYSISAFDQVQPPNESPVSAETAIDY